MSMRIVLFDLDGTLLDTSKLIMASLVHAVKAAGADTGQLENFTWGHPLRDVLRQLCGEQDQVAFAAYQEFYEGSQHMISLFPGMDAVIDELLQADMHLAVVTNKGTERARRDLKDQGLAEVFPVLVGREQVRHPKPHPEAIFTALQLLGESEAAASEALMLGDTPWDMMAGQAAGTMTGGVLWGPDPAALLACDQSDILFESPIALREWLSEQIRSDPTG